MKEEQEVKVEGDGSTMQYLTFNIKGQEYAVDIMSVREIKGWSETTRLPGSPEYMMGVINLRGIIVPIFDLRMRFNSDDLEITSKNAIIILIVEGKTIGVLVDSVSDILSTNSKAIQPPPSAENNMVDSKFITGLISLDDRMVIVLDIGSLFSEQIADFEDNNIENTVS